METQQILSIQIKSSAKKQPAEQVFLNLINSIVDEVLSSLGVECRQVICDHLEQSYDMNADEIANCPEEFSDALRQIFGDAAALLEIRMMQKIHRAFPKFRHKTTSKLTFANYVNEVKRAITE